jgi:hypothetical protein
LAEGHFKNDLALKEKIRNQLLENKRLRNQKLLNLEQSTFRKLNKLSNQILEKDNQINNLTEKIRQIRESKKEENQKSIETSVENGNNQLGIETNYEFSKQINQNSLKVDDQQSLSHKPEEKSVELTNPVEPETIQTDNNNELVYDKSQIIKIFNSCFDQVIQNNNLNNNNPAPNNTISPPKITSKNPPKPIKTHTSNRTIPQFEDFTNTRKPQMQRMGNSYWKDGNFTPSLSSSVRFQPNYPYQGRPQVPQYGSQFGYNEPMHMGNNFGGFYGRSFREGECFGYSSRGYGIRGDSKRDLYHENERLRQRLFMMRENERIRREIHHKRKGID